MSSSSQPTSPSQRNPLTLLSKLKRQLSKPPITQHQKQPIEHQYLPIPTVSFSESVHSNRALSTYSCSNSSHSSFVLIDHNEQPASVGADEYRPFLPLIIQHERLQQQRLVPPRLAPSSAHRARTLPPPPNEPPSPTSTASSKSPVTPIFPSSFFDEDEDGIMTMTNSEVGSISEYSLPRSLSAYMDEARNRRGMKSDCQTSSDSGSRHRRCRGMSVRTPPPRIISRKSFPPISPPPSCPLPEPPVSVKPTFTAIRPKTAPRVTSDDESMSLHPARTRSLRNESMAPPSLSLPLPALALSPAICLDNKIKKSKTRPQSTTTILSDLEIFDSPTYAITTTPTSDEPSHQKDDDDDDDDASPSTRTSVSTPTTPRQYGIGRQVLRGSGSGRDFDFIGSNPKRLSASAKRDSTGMEKKESRLSLGPESALDSKAEKKSGNVVESHPEWTLFLGIPRNAAPPLPPHSVLFSTGETNAIPDPASTVLSSTAAPAITQRHSTHFLNPTMTMRNRAKSDSASTVLSITAPAMDSSHFLTPTMTMRNRTKSDSALLASASAAAPALSGAEVTSKTKTTRGEEDWTLSLPLVLSPTAPSSSSSAEVLRGHSDAPSGSGLQPVVVEEEECQPRVREVDAQDLVITVEDVDKGKQKLHEVPIRRRSEEEEEEEDQDPLIFRVPRIVRSCSSYPLLSTATTTSPAHSRIKKGSSTKWMGMGAISTPNLRRGISSCTLEEEVMSMLLDDLATEEDDNESQSKSQSQSKLSKKDLAKKKMATLDEDLARFNALLKNGNLSGTGSRPVSSIIESAVAAAAAAATPMAAPTAAPTTTKPKAVTINSRPDSIPTPATTAPPSLRKKSTSSQTRPILKPVLKSSKSCEPFLESSDSGAVHSSSPPPNMGPVMRFPSSTGRGDLNFFDELDGHDGHGEPFKPSRASLRLTKSAEWIMGELGLTAPPVPTTISSSASVILSRASPSPPPLAQQQRTFRSNSPPTTQTPLLPFAHSNTKFASSSSSALNLKSKGSMGRFETSGNKGGVPTMPFRAVSMGSMSSSTVESTFGFSTSQTEKHQQQHHHHHHQKRNPPPAHLPLHTSSNSSSSSSASSLTSTSPPRPHISVSVANNHNDADTTDSPLLPPSPIPSESSSALPTPLASAFPLPPSSPPISISGLDSVVAFQQKLREFENQQQQQQQQRRRLFPRGKQEPRGKQQHFQFYKPPSTASSFSSLVSTASSTNTVVPSGDQKVRMMRGGGAGVQERGREVEGDGEGDVQEPEEEDDSMCSSTYYTARSSFSHDRSRSPGV